MNVATTPANRAAIQSATGSDYKPAHQFDVAGDTLRKWRKRQGVHDASHTPHRLHTTLNAGQEELVVYLRTHLRLPLEDLLAVVQEFIEPAMTRSAPDHRLPSRRGHCRPPVAQPMPSTTKQFKTYELGCVHIAVKYLSRMADESAKRYAFVTCAHPSPVEQRATNGNRATTKMTALTLENERVSTR